MENGQPTIGVIYAPKLQEWYFAQTNLGAFSGDPLGRKKIIQQLPTGLVLARSRHYHTTEIDRFAKLAKIKKIEVVGAALKFGRLAAGKVSVYLRYAPCSEWDTAAGHCIVATAGGTVVDLKTHFARSIINQILRIILSLLVRPEWTPRRFFDLLIENPLI